MKKKEGKPVEIRINVYANATGPKFEVMHVIKMPVFNMSKEDCQKFRESCSSNPYMGTVHILLDNGCHI